MQKQVYFHDGNTMFFFFIYFIKGSHISANIHYFRYIFMHTFCYCTIHVYVVIFLWWCVIVLSGSHFCRICPHIHDCILPLEIQLSRGEGCDPINRCSPATFECPSPIKTWISNTICGCLFYVQWFEVRDGCVFCWYWLSCWLTVYKLSIHNSVSLIFYFS